MSDLFFQSLDSTTLNKPNKFANAQSAAMRKLVMKKLMAKYASHTDPKIDQMSSLVDHFLSKA